MVTAQKIVPTIQFVRMIVGAGIPTYLVRIYCVDIIEILS